MLVRGVPGQIVMGRWGSSGASWGAAAAAVVVAASAGGVLIPGGMGRLDVVGVVSSNCWSIWGEKMGESARGVRPVGLPVVVQSGLPSRFAWGERRLLLF